MDKGADGALTLWYAWMPRPTDVAKPMHVPTSGHTNVSGIARHGGNEFGERSRWAQQTRADILTVKIHG